MSKNSRTEPPEPGWYPGASEIDYRLWNAVSFTRLSKLEKTPAHCRAYLDRPPDPGAAAEFGSAVHMAILEPDRFSEEYFQAPDGDKRLKATKAEWAMAEAENPGKSGIRGVEWRAIEQMRDAVWRHPYVGALMKSDGTNELSFVWKDETTGLDCKGRVDRLCRTPDGWPVAVDFKSIADADPRKVIYAIRDRLYHCQGALYLDGLNTLAPLDRRWILVFVEKSYPFCPRVVEVAPASMDLGRRKVERWLATYQKCAEDNYWPGYTTLEQYDVPAQEFEYEEVENGD